MCSVEDYFEHFAFVDNSEESDCGILENTEHRCFEDVMLACIVDPGCGIFL